MDYMQRKAARTEHYNRFVFGWRLRQCVACSGSGRYDTTGSPDCGACDGTGKTRYNTATGTTKALPVRGDAPLYGAASLSTDGLCSSAPKKGDE